MPVVARLSKRFYDELGEDIANELVELLNQVDDSSRKELRELNELNFARFDAKLEQRVVETNARIDALGAQLDGRIDALGARLDGRIDALGARLDGRIDALAARLDARIAGLEKTMLTKAEFADALSERFTAQNRFLYLAMAMQFAATLGLWLR